MKKILLSFVALVVFLPTVSFASIDSNLSYGARGSLVTELQEFLINEGFLNVEATGNFYNLTKTAVIAYQGSKGLPTTGFVGPLTRAEIAIDLQESVATPIIPGCTSTTLYSPTTGQLCSDTRGGVLVSTTPIIPIDTSVIDVCENIEGVQSTVPSNMSVDGNANCSTLITLPDVSLVAIGAAVPATTTPSVSAQFITSASGAMGTSQATFNVVSTGGTGTITELTFSLLGTSGAALSVQVGNISAPVINDTAYLTGLSIPIPNGGSGAKVEALVTYSMVGVGGVPSGSTSKIRLTTVKYINGSGAQTLSSLVVDSPQMTLVGSKPTITLSLPNGATGVSIPGLHVGSNYVADVNIKADEKGDIAINTIPLRFNGDVVGTQVTITNATDLVIKDTSGSIISGYTVDSILGSGTSSASAVITFSGVGYRINAGKTVTFKIEANVSAVSGVNSYLTTGITPGASFTWTDIAGDGLLGARDGSSVVIPSYPTSSVITRS